jgi:ribulose-phosphate 3-epimerase
MIINPENYITQFIDAGSDWVSFHAEASQRPKACIKSIKARKKKVGLALSPPTPFARAKHYLEDLDYLLVMTVHPGFYGQKFLSDMLRKIEQARQWISSHKPECLLQVDGGINRDNAAQVKRAGADIIVAGASVFKTRDYKKALEDLRCSRR